MFQRSVRGVAFQTPASAGRSAPALALARVKNAKQTSADATTMCSRESAERAKGTGPEP